MFRDVGYDGGKETAKQVILVENVLFVLHLCSIWVYTLKAMHP